MRKQNNIAVATVLAACAGLQSFVLASMPTTVVPIPLDGAQLSGALTDDPNLANYRVYDLRVTVAAGDRFHTANLRATVTGGTFYIPPYLDDDHPSVARDTPPFRYLKADNFLAVPDLSGEGVIVGASNRSPTPGGPATFPSNGHNKLDPYDPSRFLPANDQMLIDAGWIDFNPAASNYPTPATYTIARLTVSKDFEKLTLVGDTLPLSEGIASTPFSFVIFAPEPAATMLLVIGAAAVSMRRRKLALDL